MTAETPVRVVPVDDHLQEHRIVQAILSQTSDIKLVGQGANGQQCSNRVGRVRLFLLYGVILVVYFTKYWSKFALWDGIGIDSGPASKRVFIQMTTPSSSPSP